MYNFDEIIDRKGTNAIKLERCKALFGTDDVLPLWVADMDFRTPDFILNAIQERLQHPILGYSMPPKEYYPHILQWVESHHNWKLSKQDVGFLPGIVPGLSFAVQSLTADDDEILVQPPVYYPFFNVIKNNRRVVVMNQLVESEGKYRMDLADFEAKITDKTKLFILCNPHNPGGRVWTKPELIQLAAICEKHNITVVSDEIHADMVLPDAGVHTPFASVSEWAAQNTVTFMAPTKVFNMPGLISSFYVIQNPALRHRFASYLESSEMNAGNIFAYIAAVAADQNGEQWRVEMLKYVH